MTKHLEQEFLAWPFLYVLNLKVSELVNYDAVFIKFQLFSKLNNSDNV